MPTLVVHGFSALHLPGNCYNIFAPVGELFGENNPPDHASLGTTLEDNLKAMRVYPGAMAQLFENDEMRGQVCAPHFGCPRLGCVSLLPVFGSSLPPLLR